jgi:hypothetical protein
LENFFMSIGWNKSPIVNGFSVFQNASTHIFCMIGVFCPNSTSALGRYYPVIWDKVSQ